MLLSLVIEKIIYLVIDLLGLEHYVRGVEFSDKPWDGTGDVGCDYSYNFRKLTFNLRAVLEFYIYQSKFLKINRNELYEFLIDNLGLRVSEQEHDYLKNTVSSLGALVLK